MRDWATIVVAIVVLWAQPMAASCGWEWFVVPLGAPPIGWFHALGLVLLFSSFGARAHTGEKREKKPHDSGEALTSVSRTMGGVLALWGAMALAHYLPIWWVS
jgi:uncharacterized membrane protein